jgi:phosphatidylglycerol---prolipoprotein diacylglyceryl transferase
VLSIHAIHTTLAYIVINLDPALHIGPFSIHLYGLGYVLGISIALWAILRYADALGIPRDHVWRIFLWAAVAGLIGGRLYFVIQQPDLVNTYLKNPINIIAVWNGGMAFFGAIFGAAPTAAILAWRNGLSPWIAFDLGALFGAVGQMFGRLGNLINGDIVGYAAGNPTIPGTVCLHDPCIAYVNDPSVLPWATAYLHHASFVSQIGVPYQPAAFYEILINLVALAILWPLRLVLPRKIRAGTFFCLYVAMYSIGQFIVFFWRSNEFVDFMHITTLKQAQWTAIFTLIGIAIFYAILVRQFGKPWLHDAEHPAPPPPEAGQVKTSQAF